MFCKHHLIHSSFLSGLYYGQYSLISPIDYCYNSIDEIYYYYPTFLCRSSFPNAEFWPRCADLLCLTAHPQHADSEIGRRFANRDHTTVIHAVKTITRLSEQDDEMKRNITQIKSLLLEQ